MKIRWSARRVRLRLDDLEVGALQRGEAVTETLAWPDLGWVVRVQVGDATQVAAGGGALSVQLSAADLAALGADEDGLTLTGAVRVQVQQDYRPEHAR